MVVVGSCVGVGLSEDIGSLLRELREARGLNQVSLADALGISKQQLYQIETGRYTPTLRVLESILDELDAHLLIELDEGGLFTDSSGPDGPPAQETR